MKEMFVFIFKATKKVNGKALNGIHRLSIRINKIRFDKIEAIFSPPGSEYSENV